MTPADQAVETARPAPFVPSRQALSVVLFLVAMAAAWQLAVMAFAIPAYLLPSPIAVSATLVNDWRVFLDHTLSTLFEIGVGLAAGIVAGLVLAVAMSLSPVLHNALLVPVLATQTTPVVAIAPILIIWFGFGLLPKVIVIAIFSFFPVMVNTLAGLQATGRQMVALMDSVAATPWQVYRYVRIPMALPHVFAGLRLAAAHSVIGAVVVQWVASTHGLGYLLILHQSRLNIDKCFATLVILMTLGVGVFVVTSLLEKRFSWAKRLGID